MAFAISQNLFEPSASKESLLSDTIELPRQAEDRGLFYVDSAGAYAGSYGSSYKPSATDVLVVQYAGSRLILQYVTFDGSKERGEPVSWTGAADGEVGDCVADGDIAGVVLCDVADGDYAWIAIAGSTVQALAGSSGVTGTGTLCKADTAGFIANSSAAVAGQVSGIAKSMGTVGASALGKFILL
jgi:hypothetical protein